MSNQLISKALSSRLNTLASKPPIAWENTSYTPITGTLYLKESTLPAADYAFTLSRSVQKRGIYQVLVISPLNTSKFTALQWADTIAAHFARNTILTSSSVSVKIGRASIAPAIIDDINYIVPISIPYTSFVV